jgi:hypothetical protein
MGIFLHSDKTNTPPVTSLATQGGGTARASSSLRLPQGSVMLSIGTVVFR